MNLLMKTKLFLASLRYKSRKFYIYVGGSTVLLLALITTIILQMNGVLKQTEDQKKGATNEQLTLIGTIQEQDTLYEIKYTPSTHKTKVYQDNKPKQTVSTTNLNSTTTTPLPIPKLSKEGYSKNSKQYVKWYKTTADIKKVTPKESIDYLTYLQQEQGYTIQTVAHNNQMYEVYLKTPQDSNLYRVVILQNQLLYGHTTMSAPPTYKQYLQEWGY